MPRLRAVSRTDTDDPLVPGCRERIVDEAYPVAEPGVLGPAVRGFTLCQSPFGGPA